MPTHWRKTLNPDYLGSYAFEPGEEKTVTIDRVTPETITGAEGKREECNVAYFREAGVKPLILNSTNSRTIEKLTGSPYLEEWTGARVILYVKKVHAFGETVDAVRVKLARVTDTCADCGRVITAAGKLTGSQVAELARQRFGRSLCAQCGKKAASSEAAGGGG